MSLELSSQGFKKFRKSPESLKRVSVSATSSEKLSEIAQFKRVIKTLK